MASFTIVKTLNKKKFIALLLIILMQFLFIPLPKARAYSNPTTVDMLTIDDFAALAKTLISSPTGPTVLNDGDLGIDSPGTCTGFASPCTASGTGTINNGAIQYQNAVALQGQTDATAVVGNLNGRTPDDTLIPQLGGLTLEQGVYEVSADTTNLTGNLTLTGDADSIFIFQMTSTLITDAGSSVTLTGGAQACNVFWTVATAATFNDDTEFVGTVIAGTSVTFPGGGATLAGRAIAQTAAITFNDTTVNNSSCASSSSSSSSSNVFGEDNSCPATTPSSPQWASRQQTEDGVNLTWSAMGGSKVDIEIANSEGNFIYKYVKVSNTGHMFLPGVTSSQAIRIRVFNECEYGDWLIVPIAPGLPNTGFAPHGNNLPWYVAASAFVLLSFFLIPTRLIK